MQKLNGIQWLRGAAAILVVMFHAAGRWGYSFGVGEAGVDIFFIMSGFIMWTVADSRITPLRFLRDRVARIVPIYWFATGLMALGGLAGLFPHLIVTAPRIVQSLLFIPYVSDGLHAWPLLVQGWTLNYEMLFYLIFACLIPLPKAFRLGALVGILSLLTAFGYLWPPHDVALAFFTDPILLEFAVGALLGQYFTHGTIGRPLAIAMVLLGVALFTVDGLAHVQVARVLTLGLPAVLIVSGTIAIEKFGIRFGVWPLVFLGDASYSIYLFHTFAISLAARVLHNAWGGLAPVIATVLGVGVGCAAYVVLEKPIARKLKRKKPVSDAAAITGAVLGRREPELVETAA